MKRARPFLIFLIAAALSSTSCSMMAFRCLTRGMLPTIGTNDLLMGDPLGLERTEILRFDIMAFRPNAAERESQGVRNETWVMRVIGLPGETIEIKDGRPFVNGVQLEEPFERGDGGGKPDAKRNFGPIRVPAGEYFLLGDNRPESFDGRYWKTPTIRAADMVTRIVDIKKDFYK